MTQPLTERLRRHSRDFLEAARLIRPHPSNPHTVKAGDVSRFVDVACPLAAQFITEAADHIEALEATQAELVEALKHHQRISAMLLEPNEHERTSSLQVFAHLKEADTKTRALLAKLEAGQ